MVGTPPSASASDFVAAARIFSARISAFSAVSPILRSICSSLLGGVAVVSGGPLRVAHFNHRPLLPGSGDWELGGGVDDARVALDQGGMAQREPSLHALACGALGGEGARLPLDAHMVS